MGGFDYSGTYKYTKADRKDIKLITAEVLQKNRIIQSNVGHTRSASSYKRGAARDKRLFLQQDRDDLLSNHFYQLFWIYVIHYVLNLFIQLAIHFRFYGLSLCSFDIAYGITHALSGVVVLILLLSFHCPASGYCCFIQIIAFGQERMEADENKERVIVGKGHRHGKK